MKKLMCSGLLFSWLAFADIGVTPTYVVRSAGQNRVLLDVGGFWNGIDQQFASGNVVGNDSYTAFGYVALIPAYSASFDSNSIANALFGCDACNGCISVQGSHVVDRKASAWLADYLYLSPDFNGGFSITPTIENAIIDFDCYLCLDSVAKNCYLRLNGPLNWTKWNMQFCEQATTGTGYSGYSDGYFAPDSVAAEKLNQTVASYMQGCAPAVDGITMYGLEFAKFGCSDNTRVGFADIHAELGWNFIKENNFHVGISLQSVFPTGSKYDAEFVFNPMIGNGKHWELGAGLSTHYSFWFSSDEEKMAMIYCDLSVTHLFNAYENRTFDLSGKPNSRYCLAQKLTPIDCGGTDNLTANSVSAATSTTSTPPHYQFDAIYSPVANLTTASLKIGSAVQVDFVLFFDFLIHNFDIQIGYNLWARSADRIANNRECCSPLSIFNEANENSWALKGDAQMYGYATVTAGGLVVDDPVPLSATQSGASIHNGTNYSRLGDNAQLTNLGVDSAEYAYAGTNNQRLNYARGLANVQASQIKTSLIPELIGFSNINLQATRGLSNKFFAYVNYLHNRDACHVQPMIGVGVSAEVGLNKSYTITNNQAETSFIDICDDGPITSSLSQWSIWLKAGFLFD